MKNKMKHFVKLIVLTIFCGSFILLDTEKKSLQNLVGNWHIVLDVDQAKLHLVFKIKKSDNGDFASTSAIRDQGMKDVSVSKVTFELGSVRFDIRALAGGFEGTLKILNPLQSFKI